MTLPPTPQGEVQDALAGATDSAQAAISSIRTVRSFSREDMEIERYSARIDESFVLGRKLAMGYGAFISVMFGISQVASPGRVCY